ncbi:ATP-binding protein [Streptomyces sp. DSM 44917]|uniref:ATP-binding protein n=1 Tax=Streptomyces boetiae TaxID=3075541 RepID=A0ABU2L6Z0_9ACTN|nr:ATP-binding protein [Streptomyces sp. DSM 44917]MDT0307290.1 ATP-binding protein [Streptomyces sp. DSM 44917]
MTMVPTQIRPGMRLLPHPGARPLSLIVTCPSAPRCVPQMRHIGGTALREWGLEALLGTALLLISELVTNAVQHAAAEEIRVSISFGEDLLWLAVDDGSPGLARVEHAGPEAESGRGMAIVEELSEEWGTDGPRTWCVVRAAESGAS